MSTGANADTTAATPEQSAQEVPRVAHEGFVRRVPRAAGKFSGRVETPQSEEQLVSRAILGSRSAKKPHISRNHVIAGDLPEWEPLPPGEISAIRR